MNTRKIPVRVDEGQYDMLAQIRNDIGTPVAESVRRAIYEYIIRNYPHYLSVQANGQKPARLSVTNLE